MRTLPIARRQKPILPRKVYQKSWVTVSRSRRLLARPRSQPSAGPRRALPSTKVWRMPSRLHRLILFFPASRTRNDVASAICPLRTPATVSLVRACRPGKTLPRRATMMSTDRGPSHSPLRAMSASLGRISALFGARSRLPSELASPRTTKVARHFLLSLAPVPRPRAQRVAVPTSNCSRMRSRIIKVPPTSSSFASDPSGTERKT